MTRRELVLRKLHDLPEAEVEVAIKNLTKPVQARLRFGSYLAGSKSGAHSEKTLGTDAIAF